MLTIVGVMLKVLGLGLWDTSDLGFSFTAKILGLLNCSLKNWAFFCIEGAGGRQRYHLNLVRQLIQKKKYYERIFFSSLLK